MILGIIRKTLIRLSNYERVKFEDRSRLPRWLQLTLCPPRHFTGDVGWRRRKGEEMGLIQRCLIQNAPLIYHVEG